MLFSQMFTYIYPINSIFPKVPYFSETIIKTKSSYERRNPARHNPTLYETLQAVCLVGWFCMIFRKWLECPATRGRKREKRVLKGLSKNTQNGLCFYIVKPYSEFCTFITFKL
jgi:hypothetical protein